MSKKSLKILIGILIAVIAAECAGLILTRPSENTYRNDGNIAGQIFSCDRAVIIDGAQIPSYIFDETVCIAAEDLHNFGVDMINNSDGSVSLIHEEGTGFASSDGVDREYSDIPDGAKASYFTEGFSINGRSVQCVTAYNFHIISASVLESFGEYQEDEGEINISLGVNVSPSSKTTSGSAALSRGASSQQQPKVIEGSKNAKTHKGASINDSASGTVIVLDPGHGRSVSGMTAAELEKAGYVYNDNKGQWGEWRHWKSGTTWLNCNGSGCSGRHPDGGSCWYAASAGDRDTEPEINLNNALAAKKYLTEMGYEVRLTRETNEENPSVTQRLTTCYLNGDTSRAPDAALMLCIHSNAGGGRGSAYIALSGEYDQKGISDTYATDGNRLGKIINDRIVIQTSLSSYAGGVISGEPQLIAFCKSPVTCGYMEIGFYDNDNDLRILEEETDKIGRAIAEGIDEYLSTDN